jgi:F420-dependent oxidoreductase-like protein
MKLGLQVPYFGWEGRPASIGPTFAAIARQAEEAGFYSLWVMDHFLQIPGVGQAEEEMLEGYTALGYAAGVTSRLKLGTMVTGNTYRNPGVLVKAVTTLDVLSGGRAYFGVGAGWFEREHTGLGVEFGTWTQRFQKLEETLRIARQMWSDDNGPFEGRHYRLAETLCVPQPVTRPQPPILIGGRGEKKTLRFVAKYADATNIPGPFTDDGVAELRRKLDVLRAHCEREGRRYDEIEKTILFTLWLAKDADRRWLSPAQAVDMLGKFRDAGVDQAIFNMPQVERPERLELVAAEVLPQAAKL